LIDDDQQDQPGARALASFVGGRTTALLSLWRLRKQNRQRAGQRQKQGKKRR
jgi:hypothetical protein